MTKEKEFSEVLRTIGLTEGEIQVYMSLADIGKATAGVITKHANISGSKVYEVLQRLGNKGLVSDVIENGIHRYDATPPERLITFLEEKKQQLQSSEEAVRSFLPYLKQRRETKAEKTETVVYKGTEGPLIVLQEILEAGKKGEGNYGFGTNHDPYVKFFPRQLQEFIEESKKYKFRTKLLFAKGFHSPNTTAVIRYLPSEYFSPVRIMIYDNRVAIVDFTKPFTTIIIEKKEIARAYKKHFEHLWKIAGIHIKK